MEKPPVFDADFKKGIDLVGSLVVVVDAEQNILLVNKKAVQVVGFTEEEAKGKSLASFAPAEDAEMVRRVHATLLPKDADTWSEVEGRVVTKEGTVLDILWKIAAVRNKDGELSYIVVTGEDVTEKNKLNNAIKESEHRYRSYFNSASDAFFHTASEGSIGVNPSFLNMFGYKSREEVAMKGEDIAQEIFLHPEDQQKVDRELQNTGQIEKLVAELRRQDGSSFWGMVSVSVLKKDSGEPDGIQGIFIDISERIEAERKIRENEQFLQSIIENIPDMVFIKDAKELRFKLVNKVGEAVFGASKDDIIGKNDYDFFPAEQAEFFVAKDRDVIEGKHLVDIPEEPIKTSDGERFLHTQKIPIFDSKGNPEYLLGISSDITDQKKLREELIRSKEDVEEKVRVRTLELKEAQEELEHALTTSQEDAEKVKTIIQSIGDAVFVLDANRSIVLSNKVTSELSGYTTEELSDRPYRDTLKFFYESTGEENTDFIDTVFEKGVATEMKNHTCIIRKDGVKIPVADSAAPLRDRDGDLTGCVVVFRNVSQEREINKMKDEFISLASHQLRTPLTALRWSAERLQKDKEGTLTDLQRELVGDMRDSVKRLIQLVNDLLDVSRIESGKMIVDPVPTDVSDLVSAALKDSAARVEDRNQTVTVSLGNELPLAMVDPKLVRQVYLNTITNAIKYSPPGSEIRVSVNYDPKTNKIYSNITDDGYGIPSDVQGRMFEKFFRADNVTQLDTDGVGLGLYLVKEIVTLSGGELGFTSPLYQDGEGKPRGTDFWFSFPVTVTQK